MTRILFLETSKTLLATACIWGLICPLVFAQESQEPTKPDKTPLLESLETEAVKAKKPPRSILFPRENPGPYIPPEDSGDHQAAKIPLEETGPVSEDISEPGTPEETSEQSIIVGELIEESPATYGLFDENSGGFAKEMWHGTSLEKVEKLLSLAPARAKSPVMNLLLDRLLLSSASMPVSDKESAGEDGTTATDMGQADDVSGTEKTRVLTLQLTPIMPEIKAIDRHFIAEKIRKIAATGDLSHLVRYVQLLPADSLLLDQKSAEILLLAGDLSGACALGRGAMSEGMGQRFWYKLTAFCRVLEGDMDGAGIAIELLMELGDNDFVYFDLINRLIEGDLSENILLSRGLTSLDPLTYSLLNVMEQSADVGLFDQASPLLLHAAATNPNLSADVRIAAATGSFDKGRFDVDILRSLYDSQSFSDAEIDNALDPQMVGEGSLGDVLLYQAAAKQIDAVKKAEVLKIIWLRAQASDDMPRAALINKRALRSLQPSNPLITHAPHIVRALLLVDDFSRAKKWYDYVRSAAYAGNASATTALVNIWPMILLADQRDIIPWSADILDLWWNGQMVHSKEIRQQKAVLFYALCEALGHRVPENIWATLEGGSVAENIRPMGYATWRGLIQAAEGGRLGETVLLNLLAMGRTGPARLDASGLSALVRSLRAVGLEKEAHQLVVEILVSRGF